MTIIAVVTINYGSGTDGRHILKKAFDVNNDPEGSFLGSTTVDIGDIGTQPRPMETIQQFIELWCNTLSLVAKAGTQVYSANCNAFNPDLITGSTGYYQEYDVLPFSCVGSADEWGPRGNAFIASKQAINSTGHMGWMRWYCISKEVGLKGKQFSAASFSHDLDINIQGLGDFGSSSTLAQKLSRYMVHTNVLSAGGDWVAQNSPTTSLRQGIVNG
jgi:hypothetical protein